MRAAAEVRADSASADAGVTGTGEHGLGAALLAAAFPFHLVIDADMRVVQFGASLPVLVPDLAVGDQVQERFVLEAPRVPLTLQALQRQRRSLVLLRPRGGALALRGQMLVDPEQGLGYFLGSPFVNDVEALTRAGLDLRHFAIHDPVVDYMFLLQAQAASLADAQRLTEQLREAAEEHARLAAAEQALAHELNALPDLVLRLTADFEIVDIRPGPDSDLQAPPEQLVGTNVLTAIPELAEHLTVALRRAFSSGTAHSFDYQTERDGRTRFFEARVVQCSAAHGLVLVRDVTQNRELEQQLLHQAFHDPLSGLANRALFHERVTRALAGSRADDDVHVMFIDLDDFKRVNDSLGHAAGDDLLRDVAQRLTGCVRAGDTVARLGGDEFAVLLEGCSADLVDAVGSRVLQGLTAPFTLEGVDVQIGASIGVAVGGAGGSVDELLRRADVAMYTAKSGGKARVATYDPQMHDRVLEQLLLEQELRGAVAADQLRLAYQPIVDATTGAVRGAEALVRWSHPDRGVVAPGDFIPLAESTGLIVDIGLWVLREACANASRWCQRLDADFVLSVNLSPRQLRERDLPSRVAAVLAETGMPAERLVLEITESAFDESCDQLVPSLQALRALGLRVALDDFGTGQSSLSHLRGLPVDEVKIDKSFIDGIGAGGNAAVVARAVIELGRGLGLGVVAEGVEDEHQWSALRGLRCELAQGYLFSRPVDSGTMESLLGASVAAQEVGLHRAA